MGWKQRDFYLDPDDVPHLFDSNGNAGTTAWWNGQIVGCWVQDDDGVVSVVVSRDIGSEGLRALDAEASRLSTWLDGQRVGTVYPSALMKSVRASPDPGLGFLRARTARAAGPAGAAAAHPLRQTRPAALHQPP